MMNKRQIAALALVFASSSVGAAEAGPDIVVRGIVPEQFESVAGALTVIDRDALAAMQPVTAKDVLRRAPGVHVIDEDALGLKLNISVRGLNARRSGRTLLLEDGVPIQAAPYADPSAHYVPPLGRIDLIELRKGSAQILYGPQSIGGVINFVTQDVPEAPEIDGSAALGERSYRSLHVGFGLGTEAGGFRVEASHIHGDGIRDFHGTRVNEIAAKGRLDLGSAHRLTLKAAYYEEHSRLTEGGLDQARYDISPYYNPFRNDRFALDRVSAQVVHDWQMSGTLRLSTQFYYARTFRASYRQADTSTDAMTANPATGCTGTARSDYERFAVFCGNKMRPRVFAFWGIEPRLEFGWSAFGVSSETIVGVRAHFERTNRKRYNGLTADARETSPGTLLRDDNEIDTNAYSFYLQNSFRLGNVRITPGLRVEHIETVNRARTANFITVDRTAKSTESLVLPGVGLTWTPIPALTAFFGVHKGFAPPRPDRDFNPNSPFNAVRPERSTETEIGVRLNPRSGITLDATLFEMDLSDLIVEGPLVGGRSGTFVNAGRARHRGIEMAASGKTGRFQFGLSYSYLFEARFLTDVEEATSGVRGNRIPYAPEHLFDAHIGYAHPSGLAAEFGINHVGEQFANASNTRIATADGLSGTIPARSIARVSVNYRVPRSHVQFFAAIENLFDKIYLAGRVDGLFAGPQRQMVVGIRFKR